MTWFSTPQAFVADTPARAAGVNENFDAVAAAFNGIVQGGVVTVSEDKIQTTEAEIELPGSSKTITLAQASLVQVTTFFDWTMETSSGGPGQTYVRGYLNVGGSNQSAYASLGLHETEFVQATCGMTYMLELAAGEHALKLKQKVFKTPSVISVTTATSTRFSYLVFPNPAP